MSFLKYMLSAFAVSLVIVSSLPAEDAPAGAFSPPQLAPPEQSAVPQPVQPAQPVQPEAVPEPVSPPTITPPVINAQGDVGGIVLEFLNRYSAMSAEEKEQVSEELLREMVETGGPMLNEMLRDNLQFREIENGNVEVQINVPGVNIRMLAPKEGTVAGPAPFGGFFRRGLERHRQLMQRYGQGIPVVPAPAGTPVGPGVPAEPLAEPLPTPEIEIPAQPLPAPQIEIPAQPLPAPEAIPAEPQSLPAPDAKPEPEDKTA